MQKKTTNVPDQIILTKDKCIRSNYFRQITKVSEPIMQKNKCTRSNYFDERQMYQIQLFWAKRWQSCSLMGNPWETAEGRQS